MARIEVTAANFRGRDLEGSGTDTLVLIGGGTFDFNYVNFSGFSEIISESGTAYFTSIVISSEHLEDITSISSASAFYNSSIYVSGNNIALSNKTFNNIADIY
jgi:hypothetical protein